MAGLVFLGVRGERWQEALGPALSSAHRAVVVYFALPDGAQLVGERYWVGARPVGVGEVLAMLLDGPATGGLLAPVPAGTRVLRWELDGGTIWVDFSEELIRRHPGGSAGEVITIYAIVNTLTELDGIRRVGIMVEGQPLETLVGHLDLSEPLARDATLIAGVRDAPLRAAP